MFGISSAEFAVILIIALLIVGPKQMPEVLRAFGRGYRNLNLFIKKTSQVIDDIMYDSEKIADKAEKALSVKQEKSNRREKDEKVDDK